MMIAVHFFARARDIAGTPQLTLEIPDVATIGDLRRTLAERLPRLAPLLAHSALAINNEFAGNETTLFAGAEVALLPPVSGG